MEKQMMLDKIENIKKVRTRYLRLQDKSKAEIQMIHALEDAGEVIEHLMQMVKDAYAKGVRKGKEQAEQGSKPE